MRNQITLTDDEIEARFEANGHCITVDDLIFTRDTMDQFRATPKGQIVSDYGDVLDMGPKPTCVIDFGTVRAVCQ